MNVIFEQLSALGIFPGDALLIHSSYNALGGAVAADEFLNQVQTYLTPEGTLLLPAFSYETVLDTGKMSFDARTEPSCVGYLTNVFRLLPGAYRSAHPTHSVCARGRLARELTEAHALDDTPVGRNSPIRRLAELGGKMLFIGGVTGCCTFMHGVEEIARAPYCLEDAPARFTITDIHGKKYTKWLYCHDFAGIYQEYSRIADVTPVTRGRLLAAECAAVEARPLMTAALEKMRADPYYFVERIK